jgi:formylglycine-generating enzyme
MMLPGRFCFAVTLLWSLAVFAKDPATQPAPQGMVYIPPGTFWMGCDDPRTPDAQPPHQVSLDAFFIDATPVTNDQFEKFAGETHYVTVAERKPDPKDYPGVEADKLVAGSAVFVPPPHDVPLDDPYQWWKYVAGANWRHPNGPDSNVNGKGDYPVVQICFEDAQAYAKWAGKRLPTEAEYEYAARGGLDRKKYSWGDELTPNKKYVANIFTGHFPEQDNGADGFKGTSPVKAFPPNDYGLYDMGGNVWAWCSDWYRPDYYATFDVTKVAHNPQGPPDSADPQEPGVPKRVLRGGSFLCAERYCTRYLVGSRGKGAPDSGAVNIGLRCVKNATESPAKP